MWVWSLGRKISWVERSPGEGNGYPLQRSRLENPMDRGAWWSIVHGVTKSWTQLSNWTCLLHFYLEKNYKIYYLCFNFSPESKAWWWWWFSCHVQLLQPHGLWPTRLHCPWDFPGKNPGVGCHVLLPGEIPDLGIKPTSPTYYSQSPALPVDSLLTDLPGKPKESSIFFIF